MNIKKVWMEEIPLEKIELGENVRLEEDVSTLIISIRSQGLLQPIGLLVNPNKKDYYKLVFGYKRYKAVSDLGWQTVRALISDINFKSEQEMERYFLITNLTENTYEKPLPVEQGRRYLKLINDFKMTKSEISAITGEPVTAIEDDLYIAKTYIPPEYESKIIRGTSGSAPRKGFLPISVVKSVTRRAISAKLTKSETKDLFDYVNANEMTSMELTLTSEIMTRLNKPFNEAYKMTPLCHFTQINLVLNKGLEESLVAEHGKSISAIIELIVRGELPPEKNLIMKRSPPPKRNNGKSHG